MTPKPVLEIANEFIPLRDVTPGTLFRWKESPGPSALILRLQGGFTVFRDRGVVTDIHTLGSDFAFSLDSNYLESFVVPVGVLRCVVS